MRILEDFFLYFFFLPEVSLVTDRMRIVRVFLYFYFLPNARLSFWLVVQLSCVVCKCEYQALWKAHCKISNLNRRLHVMWLTCSLKNVLQKFLIWTVWLHSLWKVNCKFFHWQYIFQWAWYSHLHIFGYYWIVDT